MTDYELGQKSDLAASQPEPTRQGQAPLRAAFPVIDSHNHLWGNWKVNDIVEVMDEVGVVAYGDLTANVDIRRTMTARLVVIAGKSAGLA